MSEWLVERGIGEVRAALVADGDIIEARIERPRTLRYGEIWRGKLTRRLGPRRGEAEIAGTVVRVEPWPEGASEGAAVPLRIVREEIPERGRPRAAKASPVDAKSVIADEGAGASHADLLVPGPPLVPAPARELPAPPAPDELEAAGWSELIEQARTGLVAFGGGLLTIVPTPAGTTIDVDGALAPGELAKEGAAAAARAIRRLGIGGSILIDLPSLEGRAARQAAAAAFDETLPAPFERTGVNGFGLLQVVRPRPRASLVELVQNRAAESAALMLLRRAERAGAGGELTLTARTQLIAWLEARDTLLAALARRTGAHILLKSGPEIPLWEGHVHHRP